MINIEITLNSGKKINLDLEEYKDLKNKLNELIPNEPKYPIIPTWPDNLLSPVIPTWPNPLKPNVIY